MSFDNLLNQYIEQINITAKELSDVSGLGASTISRYRRGERIPSDAETFKKIAGALSKLAAQKALNGFGETEIYEELVSTVHFQERDDFSEKFNLIMDVLHISGVKLADFMNYDPSTISRIRMNKRHPLEINAFIDKLIHYIAIFKSANEEIQTVAEALAWDEEMTEKALCDVTTYAKQLEDWFLFSERVEGINDSRKQVNPSSYLSKLDEFNLDDYIESIHFNDIKVPTVPFQILSHKSYVGIKEMRNGEIDFLKATVLSKSMEPVVMCGDMPMEDMAKDLDFAKKWMMGLAVVLKKGLKIQIVHNLDRPFQELMLGLESWIPLYMTGLVQPYYIPKRQNEVYGHLHYSSGEVAMVGECISGHHEDGRYYLTRKRDEVELYKKYSLQILEKARPLMKIYTIDNHEELAEFLFDKRNYEEQIVHRYTTPAIYTMTEELLVSILKRNQVNEDIIQKALAWRNKRLQFIELYLEDKHVTDVFYNYERNDFEKRSATINLAEVFIDKEIIYTYEEYCNHVATTYEFKKTHSNYDVIVSEKKDFKNIQFTIARGKWVLVSKETHPNICFLIMHPVLRQAIENMKLIVTEN